MSRARDSPSRSPRGQDFASRIKTLEEVIDKAYTFPGHSRSELFKIIASAESETSFNNLVHKAISNTLNEADLRNTKTKAAAAKSSSSSSSSSASQEGDKWELIPTQAVSTFIFIFSICHSSKLFLTHLSFFFFFPSLLYRIRPLTRRRKRPLILAEARTSEGRTPLQLEEVEAAAEELNALLAEEEEATAEADRRLLSRLAALSIQAAALVVRAAPPQLQSKCHNQTRR
jgi:hypothetical protein